MRKFTLLCLAFAGLFSSQSQAQLAAGDIAFCGWNADGNDDFAIVALKDIPANTTIYFTDTEWDGAQFDPTDEGDFTWNSGANLISAGTILTFEGLSNPAIAVSHGSITFQNSGGLSSSSEAIFAFLGTAPRVPTTMLAAIANEGSAFGTLSNSGLIQGITAIVLPSGVDVAEYNGSRSGVDANGYLSLLNEQSNWLTQDGSGDQHNDGTAPDVPFNTTAFTFSSSDITAPFIGLAEAVDQFTVKVYFSEEVSNTSAQNVANYSFSPGVSINSIAYSNKVATINHAGLADGISHVLNVSGIQDLSGNTQAGTFTSNSFFFNASVPNILITEIMYNAPSSRSDLLEFVELTNVGSTVASVGGFVLKEEGNFSFTMPQLLLQPNEVIVLATDKDTADLFYGISTINLGVANVNALGNGGEWIVLTNASGDTITALEYDDALPWPLEADGNGPSLELRDPAAAQNDGNNWRSSTNFINTSFGDSVFASPGVFNPELKPIITFGDEVYYDLEGGSVTLEVTFSAAPTTGSASADIVILGGTATAGADYATFTSNVSVAAGSTQLTQTITINFSDNNTAQDDRYLMVALSNIVGADEGGISTAGIYILDDENRGPEASNALDIQYVTSYLVDADGSAEIVEYDPSTKRLFVMNSTESRIEILDFSNPSAISSFSSLDLSAYGIGGTSVAVHGNLVAAAVEGDNLGNGKVIFFDTDGNYINDVEVGVLPDMVVFTHDGNKVLTANEGQPNADYTIDPEGTISIIDISGGVANIGQSNVTTVDFTSLNNPAALALFRAGGGRIFGPNATFSQDLEPEYITISSDNSKAFVTLQENNAVAIIDLTNNTLEDVLPLGFKDHSIAGNGLDASDRFDTTFIAPWPIKGVYMPDAIANYEVNGKLYLVTANEGDAREYNTFEEEIRVGDDDYVLDETVFPNAAILKNNNNLGRLTVTNATGDTDGDGDFDEIHVLGARSFTIWDADNGSVVYDSGDDIERITANDPVFGSIFNASNSGASFKNRSDNKGPEPEGVYVANINGNFYAFIALERIGGVMTYDITDPTAPEFVSWLNNRDIDAPENSDLGPEGITYISGANSPIDTGLIVVANEISATLSVFKVADDVKPVGFNVNTADKSLAVYPNPAKGVIFFNQPVSFVITDVNGRVVAEARTTTQYDISALQSGVYLVQTIDGKSTKLVVE